MTEIITHTCWWLPCYGLIGAIVSLPWATGVIRRTGQRPAAYFNLLMTLLASIHGWLLLSVTWNQPPQEFLFHWLQVADLDISLILEISPTTTGTVEAITSLSLLAQLYALGYMEKDWALARFFALLGFFEGAMVGIALSDSLFLTYALLEMLTLSTYLLVGFWYAQPLVVTAARDAFLTKRVGDILLLMGVVALATMAGSLNFSDLYEWAGTNPLLPWQANLLGLALIAGPIGKCAQFPLHLWLDEAMEGPNPASVLRNSLVVGIGTYVLIKLLPVLAMSPLTLSTLVVIGTVTAIGASLVAIAQTDIKRALSHSTSAYLGLVFISIGTGRADIAAILLLAHAVAKALLFMSIGSVIQVTSNQNLTEMGGLWSRMPATTTAFVVGTVGVLGVLPLGGFWAMGEAVKAFWVTYPWQVVTFFLVNGVTAFGLTRVFRLVFLGKPQPKTRRTPEVIWSMALPMVALSVIVLLMPVLMKELNLLSPINYEYLNNLLAEILLVISGGIGCMVGALIYLPRTGSRSISLPVRFVQDLLAYDFYIDRLYRVTVVFTVSLLAKITAWIDLYIVDGAVNLVGLVAVISGQSLKYNVSGKSQFYVLTILLGIAVLATVISYELVIGHWSLFISK
ncbi:MAG: NAD(P)H-quinone oxidoreductase subunit F [Symploca sp. SIO3C6]|nr:NAD(P)H-quinone oxidoreductase subunit F [Symploca sp. SIO3C6]NET03521.1 NAD(P)H-quinone oxidoreductase subunit F [Symploca sp. SIO2B6]